MMMLQLLARRYGVDVSGVEHGGCERVPALLAVLHALGAPAQTMDDIPHALREARQAQWRQTCEPVAVTWDGEPVVLDLRLPSVVAAVRFECLLDLENGGQWRFACRPTYLPLICAARVEGEQYEIRRLTLALRLPWGYHRLCLGLPTGRREVLIIAAPRHAYTPPGKGAARRTWGGFIPLYALHSGRSWGTGDLTDMAQVLDWLQSKGASFFGTLPLLPAFLGDEPYDPSPYAPVSRLFWNEFYLDVTRVEETGDEVVRDLLASTAVQQEIHALRALPLVDYRRVMHLKRRVLERCMRGLEGGDHAARRSAFASWVAAHPIARDYARFRAVTERRAAGWPAWPQRMRDGDLREGDGDPEVERYHLYVQWLAQKQYREVAAAVRGNGRGLYLDLPLGVHGAGYDVWRERSSFALQADVGAPPDGLCAEGQNWGFPPLHPERIRRDGYRYYIAVLRHHLRLAGILRLDHIAGLHRLYWVPRGWPAREGTYVRYRAEEFYAIIALESRRHRAVVVGEDLGNVPPWVRTAMADHRIHDMYVLPFETTDNPWGALRPGRSLSLACLNTHDMPPFAGYWGRAKDQHQGMSLAAFLRRCGWLKTLTGRVGPVLASALSYLAAGRSRILLVNLEDLWLESAAQNVPGTGNEHPNWRRKARCAIEEFTVDPGVSRLLKRIDTLRRVCRIPLRKGAGG